MYEHNFYTFLKIFQIWKSQDGVGYNILRNFKISVINSKQLIQFFPEFANLQWLIVREESLHIFPELGLILFCEFALCGVDCIWQINKYWSIVI